MSGTASGTVAGRLLPFGSLTLGSGGCGERDKLALGLRLPAHRQPTRALAVPTHRPAGLLPPRRQFFGHKLLWLHSHKLRQRDFFTQNTMKEALQTHTVQPLGQKRTWRVKGKPQARGPSRAKTNPQCWHGFTLWGYRMPPRLPGTTVRGVVRSGAMARTETAVRDGASCPRRAPHTPDSSGPSD